MPSPRAVLADIARLRLDPTKEYCAIGADGHLKVSSDQWVTIIATTLSDTHVPEDVIEVDPPQTPLIILTESLRELIDESPAITIDESPVMPDKSVISTLDELFDTPEVIHEESPAVIIDEVAPVEDIVEEVTQVKSKKRQKKSR